MLQPDRTRRERALRSLLRSTLSLPRPVLAALAGPPRRNDRGELLDLELQVLLRLEGLQPQELGALVPEVARERFTSSSRIVEGEPRPLERVHDLGVAG